jgi:HSP20 family protein
MAETLPIKRTKSIFDELDRMHDRIMRRAYDIFHVNGDTFGRDVDDWLQAERELVWTPAIELEEKDGEFKLQIAVPGMDPKDVEVSLMDNVLTIKGERKADHDTAGKDYFVREVAYGAFQRSFALPEGVDGAQVEAKYAKGMLEVRVPAPQAVMPRTIEVKAA